MNISLKRSLYMSQLKQGTLESFRKFLQSDAPAFVVRMRKRNFIAFSLFSWEHQLFLYTEASSEDWEFQWPEAYTAWLETWPDWSGYARARNLVPLMDVFHDNRPDDTASWRGVHSPQQRIGKLARLKPEMYSSYVFYHFQKQEEEPGSFNDRYIIGAYENLLFSYHELPAIVSEAPTGLLQTNNSPEDWHGVMHPHFDPWTDTEEEGEKLWRSLEELLSF
ncbi:hypothetical protein AB4114_18415 [Paenibacillus sp. 2RAB27]|uniref:hypothetical protein n=1 Tax=Paenibacillus sp. 2RAB27 TaxID=3232991 RepID=UPI003F9973BB